MTGDGVLEIGPEAQSRRETVRQLLRHRTLLTGLARADFRVSYKRAALGVLWAVVVPVLQAAVLATILSHVVRFSGQGSSFGAYVVSGVLPWAYFSRVLTEGSTAIVDGAAIADKIWFPRAVLPLVPTVSELVSLAISMAVLVGALLVLDVPIGLQLLWLVPACVMLWAFSASLVLVVAALHVYFRDVRHLVQAMLLLWFYATPIFYPASLLGRFEPWVDLNPMTGVIALFRAATVGVSESWGRAAAVSVATTLGLAVVALETYRRHERLFVDKL